MSVNKDIPEILQRQARMEQKMDDLIVSIKEKSDVQERICGDHRRDISSLSDRTQSLERWRWGLAGAWGLAAALFMLFWEEMKARMGLGGKP